MSHLWLPENEGSEELQMGEAFAGFGRAIEFRRTLKSIDERLDLVYAKKGATLVPQDERWYIIYRAESGIGGMWQVCDEHGEYCEPDERHLEALLMQNPERNGNAARRVRDGRAARKKQREANRARNREHFQEGLLDRLDHLLDARIAVPSKAADSIFEKKAPAQPAEV